MFLGWPSRASGPRLLLRLKSTPLLVTSRIWRPSGKEWFTLTIITGSALGRRRCPLQGADAVWLGLGQP